MKWFYSGRGGALVPKEKGGGGGRTKTPARVRLPFPGGGFTLGGGFRQGAGNHPEFGGKRGRRHGAGGGKKYVQGGGKHCAGALTFAEGGMTPRMRKGRPIFASVGAWW